MNKMIRIVYMGVFISLLSAMIACNPSDEGKGKFSLSCGSALNLIEGATEIITVNGADEFTITTDNNNAQCIRNDNNTITVTGVKVGKCTLTVTHSNNTKLTCAITISKSSAQMDFEIIPTPRVENWLSETLYTETTPALQVTREVGINAAGHYVEETTTYGFYFTETGAYCRVSAQSDFTQRGIQPNGMVAIYTPGQEVEYYLCEKLEIVNILNGKLWIVASMTSRPDIRIVTEIF